MDPLKMQKTLWVFRNEEHLAKIRRKANSNYIKSLDEKSEELLTPEEELVIVKHYEKVLKDFLIKFRPRNESLPREVKGTVFQLYKRFFSTSSVMDYHPREMMIACIFLACKIRDFVVPIDEFVQNIDGDKQLLKYIIIDQELELLARIRFQLIILNPYENIENIILDMKNRSKFHNPDRLHEHINRFLATMWETDVCLLYRTQQIALAAVMHAASRCKENIDNFIMFTHLGTPPEAKRNHIKKCVHDIRTKVMSQNPAPTAEELVKLEQRLSKCRNPLNNPKHPAFKKKMQVYYGTRK